MKNKFLIRTVSMFSILLLVKSVDVFASTNISMGVSPSKVYDEHIERGHTKTFEFNVANTMDISKGNSDIKIVIKGSLEDEFGTNIESKDIVSFDKGEVFVKPNSIEKIRVNISIPDNFASQNYRFYIDFEHTILSDTTLGKQVNVLRVPMYIFAGDIKEYNSLVYSYNKLNEYISINGIQTTLKDEFFNNIKKVLNPLNVLETYRNIIQEPLYLFKTKDYEILDFSNSIYTLMKNVSTPGITSDKNYISYKEEDLNKKLLRAIRNPNGISVILEDNSEILIDMKSENLIYIESQLKNISKIKSQVTLNTLMEYLMVPRNKGYEIPKVYLITEIENNGDIPIVARGEYELNYNSIEVVSSGKIMSPTIDRNTSGDVKTLIRSNDLKNGVYSITGNIKGRDIESDIYHSFKVDSYRYYVVILLTIFLVIYYGFIVLVCSFLFKKAMSKIGHNKDGKNIDKKSLDIEINDSSNDEGKLLLEDIQISDNKENVMVKDLGYAVEVMTKEEEMNINKSTLKKNDELKSNSASRKCNNKKKKKKKKRKKRKK